MTQASHEVVVIGAGIIGLSVAMHLVQRGLRVTVIDRKGVAREASGRNAGALAFSDILPLAGPRTMRRAPRWLLDPLGPLAIRWQYLPAITPWLLRFALACRPARWRAACATQSALMGVAREAFPAMLAVAGAAHLIRSDGSLEIYENSQQRRAAQAGWEMRAELGIAFEHVEGERLAGLQPGLAASIHSATFVPQWQTVSDPFDVACALADWLRARDVRFAIDDVRRLAPNPGNVAIDCASGATHHASHVVIAAGAWSAPLAAQAGDRIPLDTERGYNTTLPTDAFDLRRQLIFSAHGFVATPLASGIRIGGAVEFGGLSLPPDYRRSQNMLAIAARLLPGLRTDHGRQWMGFRPSLPDSLPVIGHARASQRIVHAFGHGHLGLTQSAATGRLVADLITGAAPPIDLRPLRADRFTGVP